jgi:2-oxoglutarate dehydrogenase E1 component
MSGETRSHQANLTTTKNGPPPSVNGWNGRYVDELYSQWLEDPASTTPEWARFFEGFDLGAARADTQEVNSDGPDGAPLLATTSTSNAQHAIDRLRERFHDLGHLSAHLNPLASPPPLSAELDPTSFGLVDAVKDTIVDSHGLHVEGESTVDNVIAALRKTWCGSLGAEISHIRNLEQRTWLAQEIERLPSGVYIDDETRRRILRELVQATGLEQFLMRRYIGKKWFSLEGNETLIPVLNELLYASSADGVEELAFGMAHRGRINVLVNILEKSYQQLFTEFEESWAEDFLKGGGDVKYHRGFSSDVITDANAQLHLSMSSNPSHLEWGHPVIVGRVRAKQRLRGDDERRRCIPVLIHGDASFPGQGIVQETLNLADLDGYTVGGSIHVIINNQIGFTTEPHDLFTGRYCTDIARGYDAPVFHVNGHDPETCVQVMNLAYAYRQRYKRDVIIDLYGFRKYGHNETDEPAFTQPEMYAAIKSQTPIVEQYAETLLARGVITQDQFETSQKRVQNLMDESQESVRAHPIEPVPPAFDDKSTWAGVSPYYDWTPVDTAVDIDTLRQVANALGQSPETHKPHRKLDRILAYRGGSIDSDEPLDWAMGELLAYGTLLKEGVHVRLTGEDVQRGTFSHRHSVLVDSSNGSEHIPLNHIAAEQGNICIHNSPVTEGGCIGFEYGYSLGDPNMLVVWEAQFGDFANAGQVFFDQFIASAEKKWARWSGIVILLPHGYEGQGPEHSSARLERFLQLCADNNMDIINPTTPAQVFHMFRRQAIRAFRKPLIVMTPKSLLRHPAARSAPRELTHGSFQHIIDDPAISDPSTVDRVLFCSGKIYYDLISHREKVGATHAAILRVEQLYPFANLQIEALLKRYEHVEKLLWVQEEPRNMGAWSYINEQFAVQFDTHLRYIGRPENDSPAVASMKMHASQQYQLLIEAIGINPPTTEND